MAFCFAFVATQTANAGSYMQGTARWDRVSGAARYHVYYKETGETKYTHSVRDIGGNSYMISNLKPGVRYWYSVVAVDGSGKELKWSGLKKLRVMWMH